MNKIIGVLLSTAILVFVFCMPVSAEETNSSVQEFLQQLQQQVEQLKAQMQTLITQVELLRQARAEIRETAGEIKGTLKMLRQLQEGMTGEDVKLLQEILATDKDIYPEGLVTGYFGSLTKNAVKRFQKIAGIEQVGNVGSKTLSKINELLAVGAGESGKVPPGLLIAPGIRKKVDLEFLKPLPGQILPPGIAKKLDGETAGEDLTPPAISEIQVTNITGTSAKITWITNEESDSKVWYDKTTPLIITDATLSASSADLALNHEIILSGLTSNTIYYFIVSSTDKADNNEISGEETFTTTSEESVKEQTCINSGGAVETAMCCLTASNFPNTCLVGACGCDTENSHEVKICNCGEGKCFDGNECVSAQ